MVYRLEMGFRLVFFFVVHNIDVCIWYFLLTWKKYMDKFTLVSTVVNGLCNPKRWSLFLVCRGLRYGDSAENFHNHIHNHNYNYNHNYNHNPNHYRTSIDGEMLVAISIKTITAFILIFWAIVIVYTVV